ncbi:hypothetical protein [Priestia aryabhattai]|uniref:hypothetical protein n=1 Tax=Priestia aryabhattai TaxID=412384 RepID=UPI003D27AD44
MITEFTNHLVIKDENVDDQTHDIIKVSLRKEENKWVVYSIEELKTEDPLYHTKTYEVISSNITRTVTIESRVYHSANGSLDMVIKMDQTDEEEVSFVAQEKANPNLKLPVHLLYEDDGYYVVRISDLSSNWEALAFDLYQENEEKETVNVDDVMSDSETDSTEEIDAHALITTLYSDQRKVKKEKEQKPNKNMRF